MAELTHFDAAGQAHMVDVGSKDETKRIAVARGSIRMLPETLALIRGGNAKKGDVLGVARIAAIQGAKRTADLIPLCHPLPLTHVDVQARIEDYGIHLESAVSTNAQTGVEMEALTAVSVAALTVYDMCKALDKSITISEVRLERKTGGKSGDYLRELS